MDIEKIKKSNFPKVYYVQYGWGDNFEFFISKENAKKRVEKLIKDGWSAFCDEIEFEDRGK